MTLNTIWRPPGVAEVDEKDVFGTFGPAEVDNMEVERPNESLAEEKGELEEDFKV